MKEKFGAFFSRFIAIILFMSIASDRGQLLKNKNDNIGTWITAMEKYQAYIQTYNYSPAWF